MRRLQAILVVIAMLAAPLALTARVSAGSVPFCCLLTRGAADRQSGLHCNHDASHAATMCKITASCGGTIDYGFASPLPSSVLLGESGPPVLPAAWAALPF